MFDINQYPRQVLIRSPQVMPGSDLPSEAKPDQGDSMLLVMLFFRILVFDENKKNVFN